MRKYYHHIIAVKLCDKWIGNHYFRQIHGKIPAATAKTIHESAECTICTICFQVERYFKYRSILEVLLYTTLYNCTCTVNP